LKNEIQVFNFEQSAEVTVITDENNNPWFVAKEVCDILDLYPERAYARLDDDEKNTMRLTHGNPTRGNPNKIVINEYGLYNLILQSRKPQAKKFKRWITHEVLPTIRKTGGYIVNAENMNDVEILCKALDIREAQLAAKEKLLAELEPKAIAHDNVIDQADNMTTTAAAKHLGLSAYRLNTILCKMGIIFKQFNYGAKRVYSWVPKQQWIDKGYFEVKLWPYYVRGEERFKPQTLVTPDGLSWLSNRQERGDFVKVA
jgi:anti-repressor protein